MDKKYDKQRLYRLINYYNQLVDEYDIPVMELMALPEHEYSTDNYSLEAEYINGSFTLAEDSGEIIFSVLYEDSTSKHGKVLDFTNKEIADMIKKTIK